MENMNIRKEKSSIKFVLLAMIAIFIGAYGWMTLCHVGVEVFMSNKLGSIAGKEAAISIYKNSTVFAFVSYVGMEIILLKMAYIVMKKFYRENNSLEFMGLDKTSYSKKHFIYGLLIGTIVYSLSLIFNLILGSATMAGNSFSNIFSSRSIGIILIILVAMVFAAVCEEIVFRGIIQTSLMKKFNTPVSIIISSVCFSVMHIGTYSDILTLVYILFPGAVFGYLFAKTKSLYMPIGIHYSWNVLCSLLGEGKNRFATPYLVLVQTNDEVINKIIVCAVYFVVLLVAYLKYKNNKNNKEQQYENTTI